MNPPTFINGPLDPRKQPTRFIQVFATNGVDTHSKPDQVDTTATQGVYVLSTLTEEGAVYEWKGVKL